MLNKKILSVLIITSAAILQVGCSSGNSATGDNNSVEQIEVEKPNENQKANEEKVMSEFSSLVSSGPQISDVINFIEDNVEAVSQENVSVMILALEDLQRENLPTLEQKYSSSEDPQIKLREIFKDGIDLNKLSTSKDAELKALLEETKNSGYKVETAEGYYFPIIDYEIYKTYSTKATEEIQDYIDIMATESNHVPAKDGALTIGWDEVVKRALMQEDYLTKYQNSERYGDVAELLNHYKLYTFFGLNNTPLFSYDTNVIDSQAKAAYLEFISNEKNSDYIGMLKSFMDILENNNDKLTDEVDAFRKDIADFPND